LFCHRRAGAQTANGYDFQIAGVLRKEGKMANAKGHTEDKAKLTKRIEGIIQTTTQGADVGDLQEVLHYIPHPWITSVAEWTFILQLVENVEQNMIAARASRHALLSGIRQIGEAAGAQLKVAAGSSR
jgi:hypothetical protein